ncbi:MAG: DUF424 family protein [Nanoarchaeota archaeon]
MFLKIHQSYRNVVAVCDSDLVGKIFEDGNFQIEVKESFFKGEEVQESRAIFLMKKMSIEDATFNIVGEEAVNAAIKAEIISEDSVGEIQGIPFALVLD